MKPREEGGVVDSSLNVYGTKNLKIADLSIPPSNVAAVSHFCSSSGVSNDDILYIEHIFDSSGYC